ncbi:MULTISPECIES: response regulator [unclassified Arsukibacterium]|uniref:response regulator n=1 Tax=unclassified Arsukibacterium TaxID=2635278 RepID=UPI000C5CA303|nr:MULTISPECIES: response regulator [unclassified Arsukibacterium]MAA94760.1 response regulator [Rheinheimera sp.]MBM33882.1 response regulator [Rheinheimera sp.]|tara:strand:+ start:12238 stop:13869 length:1632 start_codon:yes stop_codon:yes gene_type:complete
MQTKTLENQRVLIVDDQRAFQLMFKGVLYSMGATNVAFAPTGEQALAKCSNVDFDILFVDYHLGIGKNGKQLLEDLREKKLLKPHSIFMLITGENSVPVVVSAVELEPDDYLVKPFSQSVLRSRIIRIQHKKEQLAKLFQALYDNDSEQVITLCQLEIAEAGRYQQFCKRVLTERFILLKRFTEAEQVLQSCLELRRNGWALLLMARLCFEQQRFAECQTLCDEALEENRLFAEAYDIKARSYLAEDDPEQAFVSIQAAADIAPYSMQRQYLYMDIAHALDDTTAKVLASKQLYEITRRSIRQDISHLYNYIRSIIAAATMSNDPQQRNRYSQEVAIALQRARRDDSLIRETDFDLFEILCQARLDSVNGQQFQAKKTYASVAEVAGTQQQVLPDTVLLLNQIGEFEQADQLATLISAEQREDPVLERVLSEQELQKQSQQQYFAQLNKDGIRQYKEGQHLAALALFEQALELAPMNTGCALNVIQTSLQLLKTHSKAPGNSMLERCKKAFRIVDNMPLPEHHRKRYEELLSQFSQLKQEKRR